MKKIKTYEEFRFKEEEETPVLEPKVKSKSPAPVLRDRPVDTSSLDKSKEEDINPKDKKPIVIKNWKVY